MTIKEISVGPTYFAIQNSDLTTVYYYYNKTQNKIDFLSAPHDSFSVIHRITYLNGFIGFNYSGPYSTDNGYALILQNGRIEITLVDNLCSIHIKHNDGTTQIFNI